MRLFVCFTYQTNVEYEELMIKNSGDEAREIYLSERSEEVEKKVKVVEAQFEKIRAMTKKLKAAGISENQLR